MVMFRSCPIYFLFIVLSFWSCASNKGDKRVVSGLAHTFKGLTFEEAYLLGSDSTVMLTNKVKLNGQVTIVMNGMANFVVKDNKVLPGASLTLSIGNQIVSQTEDIFSASSGLSPDEASTMQATISLAPPVMSGQIYHIKMRVWDKNSPQHELSTEVDLDVE